MSATEQKLKRVFNVMQIKLQYPRFLEITATRIANEVILDAIHQRMRARKYSRKIIDSTFIEKVEINQAGIISFDVVSDYESEKGFDVSEAREEGTFGVFVKPIFKKVLRWIDQGIARFSFGHFRRGISASNIIDLTVEERLPIVQEQLDQETDNFLDKVLKS